MSEIHSAESTLTDAQNIEARAACWLIKSREHENWSEPDQAALDAWLAESRAHAIAFWRLRAAWSSADRLGVLRRPEAEQMGAPTRQWPVARIAMAFVVAALMAATGSKYWRAADEQTYATAVGGHKTILLADGSEIELNTDTVLRASLNASQRIVRLDRGEAYFRIKHDAARPFIVLAAGHRVTDIGTEFLLRRDNDRFEMALTQGRARFEPEHTGPQTQSAFLTPGDVIVATARTVSLMRKSLPDLANELSWRRDLLVFHHTTLADAAGEYNRYNREKIVIADRAVGQLTMNGTLPTGNVGAFVRLAQRFFDLHVEKRGNEIVISR